MEANSVALWCVYMYVCRFTICSWLVSDLFASSPTVRKQKFHYSFLYLLGLEDQFSATEDVIVHLDTFWISTAW